MKCKVIINPIAGKYRTEKLWPLIKKELEKLDIDFTPVFTQKKGDAAKLASKAAEELYHLIVVVGGDGTLHEVINGVNCKNIPINIIPTGTGNDFIKSLDYPSHWKKACQIVKTGTEKKFDLGKTDGRYFLNIAGCGFDAHVAFHARKNSHRKPGFKKSYLFSTLTTIWGYKPQLMKITLDTITVETKAYLVAVANGKFYGGGMNIAPTAILDDGLFDICIISKMGKLDFLSSLHMVYNGKHLEHLKVSLFRSRTIRIEAEKPIIFHLDGEVAGTTPVEFTLIPQAITIKCPADAQKSQ